METINVTNGPQGISCVILGCMRMPALSVQDAAAMIRTAAEEGVNFFDHATCYGDGEAETRFGDALLCGGADHGSRVLHAQRGHAHAAQNDAGCALRAVCHVDGFHLRLPFRVRRRASPRPPSAG